MADLDKNKEGNGLNRRSFLKSAGVAVAGGTLGAGVNLAPEAAAAAPAVPATITVFRCPIDALNFNTFADLKSHFAEAHPEAVVPVTTKLNVNGKDYEVLIEPHWTLQRTLQFRLGLTGAKQMCDRGVCGSCTVIIDGRAVNACLYPALEVEGKEVTTIEGLRGEDNELSPIQQAFVDCGAIQCGFCTPGMIMSAKALLDRNPDPNEDEIRNAMLGNLCRCTGYVQIVEAIQHAAAALRNAK